MSSAISTRIPGYLAGTWDIDPTHSDLSFTVRHMMVSKVRGQFGGFTGEIVTAPDVRDSAVDVSIDASSINTGNEQRDGHLRSADFFACETYPTWRYRSTGVRVDGDQLVLDGELTLKGVTRSVPLAVEVGGFGPDAFGGTRAGFSGIASINRSDFGVDLQMPMDGGGVVVGDKVQIQLEIEAVLRAA